MKTPSLEANLHTALNVIGKEPPVKMLEWLASRGGKNTFDYPRKNGDEIIYLTRIAPVEGRAMLRMDCQARHFPGNGLQVDHQALTDKLSLQAAVMAINDAAAFENASARSIALSILEGLAANRDIPAEGEAQQLYAGNLFSCDKIVKKHSTLTDVENGDFTVERKEYVQLYFDLSGFGKLPRDGVTVPLEMFTERLENDFKKMGVLRDVAPFSLN